MAATRTGDQAKTEASATAERGPTGAKPGGKPASSALVREALAREAGARIERALGAALRAAEKRGGADAGGPQDALATAPPLLAGAMRHAVFPGGARVRPRLCLAVAGACGDPNPAASEAAAAAIELLHCASLVHDDLPCFDNAATRRGRPSVHARFGAPVAVLAGDAMIVLAFETLARAAGAQTLGPLVEIIGRAVGAPGGIVAGQAWESEPEISVSDYHRAKTGALFTGAAEAGAAAAGADPADWRMVGAHLGEAYQAADDLADALAGVDDTGAPEFGKPAGQDAALGRPSLVAELGVAGTVAALERLIDAAVAAIPPCHGADGLRDLVKLQAKRLTPKSLAQSAA